MALASTTISNMAMGHRETSRSSKGGLVATWLARLGRSGTARAILGSLLAQFVLTGCSSSKSSVEENIIHGTIAYPFYQTAPLGKDPAKEPFVIRSAVGASEYTVEIPGAARDYEIEIPLAAMDSAAKGGPDRPRDLASPVATDREIADNMPDIENSHGSSAALLDKALGVGKAEGPTQAPSYTLAIAKINRHYRRKDFEYALIEINHLLAFYPNSPKLHKMKGTVYGKIRNYPLAEKSWLRSLELKPNDRALKRAIQRLQRRMQSRMENRMESRMQSRIQSRAESEPEDGSQAQELKGSVLEEPATEQ